jgi:hypothetical protein
MKLAAPGDRSFAIDVFEEQHLNIDHSGAGDRAKFLANVSYWTGSIDGIAVIQKSSLEVTAESLLDEVGWGRMISIDGGHTEQCTLNDSRLSEAVLHETGLAIVDDCFDEGGRMSPPASPATVSTRQPAFGHSRSVPTRCTSRSRTITLCTRRGFALCMRTTRNESIGCSAGRC